MIKRIIAGIFSIMLMLQGVHITLAASATKTPAKVTPIPITSPLPNTPKYETLQLGSDGSDVICLQMRLRDLGYYNFKITGSYGAVTQNAVKEFQKVNGINPTGNAAQITLSVLYDNSAIRNDISSSAYDPKLGRDGEAEPPPEDYVPSHGKMYDWFKKVQYILPRGMVVTVVDYYTGIKWKMKRTGGYNHADVEPYTPEDTKQLHRVYRHWSWTRRPVLVLINGEYVAGSMNGMPHGFDRQSNNGMSGQICIHFLNSKTHIRNLPDKDHQRCVHIAAGQ